MPSGTTLSAMQFMYTEILYIRDFNRNFYTGRTINHVHCIVGHYMFHAKEEKIDLPYLTFDRYLCDFATYRCIKFTSNSYIAIAVIYFYNHLKKLLQ